MSLERNPSGKQILFTAEEDFEKRLDAFLAENTDFSRTFCQKLIRLQEVKVNGIVITKPAFFLEEGQEIVLTIPEARALDVRPENIPLDLLYEDDDVLVINKAAGMVVHPDETYTTGTLVNALLSYLGPEKLSGIGGVKRPGIVHRLDKDTSGVMIVAKNDRSHRFLATEIAARRIKKMYKTLVFGKVKHEKFSVDSPITRNPQDGKKMTVSSSKTAKPALSHVHLEHFYTDPLCSYLSVNIVTGRTHQIRVHLSSVGYPIVGDGLYGNEALNAKFFRDFPLKRIFLHSESLTLKLSSGKEMEFRAPLSADLEKTLQTLEY